MRRHLVFAFTASLAACSSGERRSPAAETARGEVVSPADTSMAGMDHSKMPGMTPDTSTSMAGMDHAKMSGMGTKTAPANAMAGMDHSKMPGMNTKTASTNSNAMAGMDHSKMPGMGTKTPPANAMAGVAHSKMPGMGSEATTAPTATTAADAKLDRLVAALVNDPLVRQRIQTDTALRRRWDEAARRTLLPTRP